MSGNWRKSGENTAIPGLAIKMLKQAHGAEVRSIRIEDSFDDSEFVMKASSPGQALIEIIRKDDWPGYWPGFARHLVAEQNDDPKEALFILKRLAARQAVKNDVLDQIDKRFRTWIDEGMPQSVNDDVPTECFHVFWSRSPLGQVEHDGHHWIWTPNGSWATPFPSHAGAMPPFLENLMPEGWLKEVLRHDGAPGILRSGMRYMSNITVSKDTNWAQQQPRDYLLAPLENWNDLKTDPLLSTAPIEVDAIFNGEIEGLTSDIAETFNEELMPRISGAQVKVPVTVTRNGFVTPSAEMQFTHILKLPGIGEKRAFGVLEWLGLDLSRQAGLPTAEARLVKLGGGAPALLVERFDIPQGINDDKIFFNEDMCSVLGRPADQKNAGSYEEMASILTEESTDPDADIRFLFRRACVTMLIGDGDAHLKNHGLLRTASLYNMHGWEPGQDSSPFHSVRLAPTYDVMPTEPLYGRAAFSSALTVNGKRSGIDRIELLDMGKRIGIPKYEATNILDDTALRISDRLDTIENAVPELVQADSICLNMLDQAISDIRKRVMDLAHSTESTAINALEENGEVTEKQADYGRP